MTANPLDEIRRLERSVSMAIEEAQRGAIDAVNEAGRRAEQVVGDARVRGHAAAERRYQEGLARARDDAERILGDADGRVTALRRRADAHMTAAVDRVMALVLPAPEEG